MYRLTPFWVILSRIPILAQDLHEARRRGIYAFKVCDVLHSSVLLLVDRSRGHEPERLNSDLTSTTPGILTGGQR